MNDTTRKLFQEHQKNRPEAARLVEQMQDQARQNLAAWKTVELELAGCWLAEDLLQHTKGDVQQAVELLTARPPEHVETRDAALDVLLPFADAPHPLADA